MIRFSGLSFKYAGEETDEQALARGGVYDINLEINKGEFALLTGLSGCGKTTLIRLMGGLVPSYYSGDLQGSLSIGDIKNIENAHISEVSKRVSTVFQNPKSQFFNLDTTSELLFYLENIGTPRDIMRKKLEECVELFGIDHLLGKDIHALSGGEKQIIQIAASFIAGTDIILMDEPTSNLDLKSIEKVKEMLKTLKGLGKTVVISEHRLYYLRELVDTVHYIENGRISMSFESAKFFELNADTRANMGLREFDIENLLPQKNVKNSNLVDKQDGLNLRELNIESLKFKWKKQSAFAVDVANIALPLGKVISLVGKNGQGKSSFAQALTGLVNTKLDSVFINSAKSAPKDPSKKLKPNKRLELSYTVMQDVGFQLFTDSVDSELSLGSKIDLSLRKPQIVKAMQLETLLDAHPQGLSGGQKQRVSIAAGICSGAKFMIFDEPTSGMDYYHMKKTADYIKSVLSDDMLIIIITHDMEFLAMITDEIMTMQNGKISPPVPMTRESYVGVYKHLLSPECI